MRQATRVIVGAPKRRGWRAWLRRSTTTELVRRARGFDVILIAPNERLGTRRGSAAGAPGATASGTPPEVRWDRYAYAATISALCTALAFLMYPHFELTNLVMVYLLGVTVAGLRLGRGPARRDRGAERGRVRFFLRAATLFVRHLRSRSTWSPSP